MIRSYSSLLRSMPVYQAQLNRTDFRSFAPAAGVYAAPPPRPPLPPPCACPPAAPAPLPPCPWPAAGAAPLPFCCAFAVGSAINVRTTAMAILIHILCREAMMFPPLVVRIAGGDLDRVTV